MSNGDYNALPESATFTISVETRDSDEIGAVVCPKCQHQFVKLVSTGIHSNKPINIKQEAIQGAVSLVTGYVMFDVTSLLIIPSSAFNSIGSTVQTIILLLTIFSLWLALPVLQYMRIYSLWLHFIYLINAVFIPVELVLLLLGFFAGGAS